MLAELQQDPGLQCQKPAGTISFTHSLYLPMIFVSATTSATWFF